MRLSSTAGGVLLLLVLAAVAAGGAYAGAAVASDITEPGTQEVVLTDPLRFEETPAWANRSAGGFTGFGGLPALPGVVLRSGTIASNEASVITVDAASATTTVDYTQPLRLLHIRPAERPLGAGDTLLVRMVDGVATGALRIGNLENVVHRVQAGETLEGIAEQYGVTAVAIVAANVDLIADAHSIEPASELVIPPGPAAHEVQAEETLEDIAERYGVAAGAIVAANSDLIVDPPNIEAGWRLVIPAAPAVHEVQAEETLEDIAGRYGVTVDAIVAANAGLIVAPPAIEAGWELVIPAEPEPSGEQ